MDETPLRPGYYTTMSGHPAHVTHRSQSGMLWGEITDDQTPGGYGWFEDGTWDYCEANGDDDNLVLSTWKPCECHPVSLFLIEDMHNWRITVTDAEEEDFYANMHHPHCEIPKRMLNIAKAMTAQSMYWQSLLEAVIKNPD